VDQHNFIDSGYESILLHKHRIDAKSQQHPMTNRRTHTHTHIGDSTGYGVNWQDYYRFNQGACHAVALPFTLKSIFMQKKNYGNSNISPCKNTIFKKSAKRNQNPSRYYNSITDLKFQPRAKIIIFPKSSYKNRAIIIT
jgi:hypothetical protein